MDDNIDGPKGVAGGPGFVGLPGPLSPLPVMRLMPAYNNEREKEIVDACATLAETLLRKNKDYGQTNIQRFGTKGILVRLCDKVERLVTLGNAETAAQFESADDSWMDAAGYGILGWIQIKKEQNNGDTKLS